MAPQLVETFGNFNIVLWLGRYHAIAQEAGPFDFATQDLSAIMDYSVVADSLAEAKRQVVGKFGSEFMHAAGMQDMARENGPLSELGLPEIIEIEPIHSCNLRCLMCHVTYEKLTKERVDVDKLVEQLQGLQGRWALISSSYEPCVHPHFGRLMQGLTDAGMKLDLTTNGTLLSPEMVKMLTETNLRNITVSFDGITKTTYEYIRKRGDFDRTIERILNLRQASDARKTYFNINQTVMKANIDEIPDSVDFWEKAGFDHMGLISMRVREDIEEQRNQSLFLDMEGAMRRFDEAALRVIENNYKIVVSSPTYLRSRLRDTHSAAFAGSIVHSRNPRYRVPVNPRDYFQNGVFPGMSIACRSPFKYAQINYNGDVVLCQRLVVGNIYREKFKDIWFGEKAQKVRAAVLKSTGICLSCSHYQFCIKAGEIDTSVEGNYTALTDRSKTYLDPVVVDHYATYWIVRWLSAYYVMPKQTDRSVLMLGEHNFPSTSTQEEALAIAKEETHRRGADWLAYLPMYSEKPETIKNYLGGNLISWNGMYIFLPQTGGPIDLREVDFNELPTVLYDADLKAIRKRIAWKRLGNLMSPLYWRWQKYTSPIRRKWPHKAPTSGLTARRPPVSERRP